MSPQLRPRSHPATADTAQIRPGACPTGAGEPSVKTPAWAVQAVDEFLGRFAPEDHDFPCPFAHRVHADRTLRTAFIQENANGPDPVAQLRQALSEFIPRSRSLGPLTSLLCFFDLSRASLTVEDYEVWFWSVLQGLHDGDSAPWPLHIPRDPHDLRWAFSFGGETFFVVCFTPAHTKRRSRHSAKPLIIFQPRWIFDGMEGDRPAGIAVREAIRAAVRAYDDLPVSPKLTAYGEGLDWEQYFLPDTNPPGYQRCPVVIEDKA